MNDQVDNDTLPPHMKKALQSIIDRPLPRIQEEDFVKYFLGGFAGMIENVPLVNWLDVAGNAMSPVEVCKGEEVLFVVPPIFGAVTFSKVPGQANTIGEIVAHAQKLNRIHPSQGERFLQDALSRRVGHEQDDFKTIREMNAIFKRYGLQEMKLPAAAGNGVTSEVQSDGKPTIETYDDL